MILPFPPSLNHYWRMARGRFYVSKEGVAYREKICALAARWRLVPMHGPLRVEILAVTPDKRRRDVDNMLKAVLDALQHAGFYADDSQIVDLHISKRLKRADEEAHLDVFFGCVPQEEKRDVPHQ